MYSYIGGLEMIIDGHAHSCGEFYDSSNIIKLLNKLNVDKVVLCPGIKNEEKGYGVPKIANIFKNRDVMNQTNKVIRLLSFQEKDDLDERNEFVYKQRCKYPDRIIQSYWVNPCSDSFIENLYKKYDLWKFQSLKLHQCFHNFKTDSVELHNIAKFAEEKKLPIFIHLYSNKNAMQLIDIIKNYSDTNFIIAHMIGLEEFIEYGKRIENIFFDISPTPLISTHRIYKAINNFGAESIILGSDTPFGKNNLKNNIKRVCKLNLSDDKKEMILGNNLKRILNNFKTNFA